MTSIIVLAVTISHSCFHKEVFIFNLNFEEKKKTPSVQNYRDIVNSYYDLGLG